jgi:hypothetical protein
MTEQESPVMTTNPSTTYAIQRASDQKMLRSGNIGFYTEDAALIWAKTYASERHETLNIIHPGSSHILTVEPHGTVICEACGTYDSFCQCEQPRYVVARYNSTTFEIQDTHTNTAPHVNLSFDDAAHLMRELNAA